MVQFKNSVFSLRWTPRTLRWLFVNSSRKISCEAVASSASPSYRLGSYYIPARHPVFRIRDILVRIRIRTFDWWIRPRILLFSSVTFRTETKNHFFLISFYASFYSFFKVHSHHSSKIKSHKEVTKQYKWKFFFLLIFLLVDWRIRSRTNKLRFRIRVQEVQHTYGSGSASRSETMLLSKLYGVRAHCTV